jgi:hypothetical protein
MGPLGVAGSHTSQHACEEKSMGKVLLEMSMSLDSYVTGPT